MYKNQDIVILHGWGSSAQRWQDVKDALERTGYQVLVPDMPGFGENPQPVSPWSVQDYAEWVKKWSEERGLVNFYLAGHSFGGAVAALFAATYPEKVTKLILIAAAIRRRKTVRKYIYLILSKIGKLLFSLPVLSSFQLFAQKFLYKIIGVNDYLVATLKSPIMQETFKKVVAQNTEWCLPNITSPTLVVWGETDKATPLSDAKLLNKAIKGSRLEIIPEAGHLLNIRNSAKLAELIGQFLRT